MKLIGLKIVLLILNHWITVVFTNFESFIPFAYKRGLINTLLFRYFNISSSYSIFHTEIEKFKKIMTQNGYRKGFLIKLFGLSWIKFLRKSLHLSKLLLNVLFYFHFLLLAYIQLKFASKSLNCLLQLIHIFKFGAFFDLYKDCRHFFALKTAFH